MIGLRTSSSGRKRASLPGYTRAHTHTARRKVRRGRTRALEPYGFYQHRYVGPRSVDIREDQDAGWHRRELYIRADAKSWPPGWDPTTMKTSLTIWTYTCGASALAGRARHRLVALELQAGRRQRPIRHRAVISAAHRLHSAHAIAPRCLFHSWSRAFEVGFLPPPPPPFLSASASRSFRAARLEDMGGSYKHVRLRGIVARQS